MTPPPVSIRRDGGIAILTVDNPPVNALSHAVRTGLFDAFAEAARDPQVRGIVLACAGRTFVAGADITEFDRPIAPPTLAEVIAAIEASAKPVVAALFGTVLGGGLEVALGCHARLAAHGTRLGLPEVTLGIIPGAGGTQRTPRLVGAAAALDMILTGEPIDAERALAIGLIDAIAAGDLAAAAVADARMLAGRGDPPRRTAALPPAPVPAGLFDDLRRTHARRLATLDAPAAALDVVERTATAAFDDGMAIEREAVLALRASDQSRALRYAFFAERAAAKVPGIDAATPRLPVKHVGVVGAGTMGSGIALGLLRAGLAVTLIDADAAALDRGVATIDRTLDRYVARGRLTAAERAAARAALHPTLEIAAVAPCQLVIEAAYEAMAVKQAVFAALDRHASPDAILATNTSYLDVDAIAAGTARPERVLGLHFFSPADVMRLLEVVRGARTGDPVLATALSFARRIGKVAVVAGNAPGFIGNRMLARRREAADAIVLEGASPYDVDRAIEAFGMPMGPFRMADLAGLDLGWTRAGSTGATVRERLNERGRHGQKSGGGYYDYDADRRPRPSVEAMAVIAEIAGAPRTIDDTEIVERLLYPMVDEAARILADGTALRGSDVDTVWLNGYGWPRWRGGPLFWADETGTGTIVGRLRARGHAPAELLVRAAADGLRLSAIGTDAGR